MLRFEDPLALLALLLVPLLLWHELRRRPHPALRYSCLTLVADIPGSTARRLRCLPLLLRCGALVLLIAALARPQAGIRTAPTASQGIDIALCLDTSGSMQALDFSSQDTRTSRLQAVKEVVRTFITGRQSDRIGMVVFGRDAFTQCPLTLDYGVLLDLLDRLEIGMAGDSTAIGAAIAICVKRLKDLPSKSKVIILLTDGRHNAGSITPASAAEAARACGIKIYTIGVGSEGKAPFPVDSLFGTRYVYRTVELDEDTLRTIARTTGGRYFRATSARTLGQVYRQIDALEQSAIEVRHYTAYDELCLWFLLPALALLLVEIVLANTRLMIVP